MMTRAANPYAKVFKQILEHEGMKHVFNPIHKYTG